MSDRCSIDECDRGAHIRGWCNMHYQRVQKYGKPGPAHSLRDMTNDETFDLYAPIGDPEQCWDWSGAVNAYGYGVFGNRPQLKAHRFAYERVNGAIPDGLMACHTCDRRLCVNPGHLYIGTNADNQRDKRVRRRVRGAKHPQARFDDSDVEAIVTARASGELVKSIALRYGVDRGTIGRILSGKSGYAGTPRESPAAVG